MEIGAAAMIFSRCSILMMVALPACGLPEMDRLPDPAGRQPSVVMVVPSDGAVVAQVEEIVVRFSQPIAVDSLIPTSFAVVSDLPEATATAAIVDGWQEGTEGGIGGAIQVAAEGLEARFTVTDPSFVVGRCAVIVTTAVHSPDGLPFTQTPGQASTPFVSTFTVEGKTMAADSPSDTGAMESIVGEGESSSPAIGTTAVIPQRILPEELMLNEIYYDAPGQDTNGVLFVELRGTPEADVGHYVIHFVNGENGVVTESITLPDGASMPADGLLVIADGMTGNLLTTQVQEADLVDNFDPQNGPESVQLVDPDGQLVDVVGYGTPLSLFGESGLPLYEGIPATDAPSGMSVSRVPGSSDTDNNGEDFVVLDVPTPGVE
ncbi:MAG: lamin tail domain-containing protein [Deltaproteobacteria bacterium]|nr:lamin tail domain-containing protein [Deltaproteobacteria bacterium]